MTTIVPRWEWRTFGTRFGIAEARFAELMPGAVRESDELYFLGGGANVKVRDALMDIKVLREVSAGLRYVLGNPWLRSIAATTGTSNLFTNMQFAILVLFLVRRGFSAERFAW